MTDGAGSRSDDDFETIEDIDADMDAVPDWHVTERLHQLLAESVLTHLSDPDLSDRRAAPPPAGPGSLHATDVDYVASLLQATQQQLKITQGSLRVAEKKRDDMVMEVSRAEIRLRRLRELIEKSSTSADEAYVDTVLERGQEILAGALANARKIVEAAEAEADRILAGARKTASLPAGRAQGRPRPH